MYCMFFCIFLGPVVLILQFNSQSSGLCFSYDDWRGGPGTFWWFFWGGFYRDWGQGRATMPEKKTNISLNILSAAFDEHSLQTLFPPSLIKQESMFSFLLYLFSCLGVVLCPISVYFRICVWLGFTCLWYMYIVIIHSLVTPFSIWFSLDI